MNSGNKKRKYVPIDAKETRRWYLFGGIVSIVLALIFFGIALLSKGTVPAIAGVGMLFWAIYSFRKASVIDETDRK